MNTIVQVAAFLLLGVVILFGAHFFVYVSLVRFFAVTASASKYLIASLLVFLSVSFIFSSIIAHAYENIATRTAYFLSGFWLGFLVNVVLACTALWLILWAGRSLGFAPNKALWGAVFIGLAFLVSLYGVWHALHPEVKHIIVRIPGIPDIWKGQTIVQLSDVHLGHVYQGDFLRGIVAQVNALHPKLVVITGDLFDGMDGRLDFLVQPFNTISAENGVFFVTGNHETYLGVEKAFTALQDTQVTILHDEVRDIDGLRLIGISFPARGEEKDIIATLGFLRDQYLGRPNVLLYHAPTRIAEVAQSGVNLMLSGHTHQGQQFPFSSITHLVHKGYDYGLYPIGEFTLYTTSGAGTWGPTMRIGTRSEIVAITIE
ncbi:MAG: metallophosphoesterase [Candidatus Moraniibacteriota bacterium]